MKTALLIGGGLVALLVVYKVAQANAPLTIPAGSVPNTSLVPGSSGGGTGSTLARAALPGNSRSATSVVAGGIEAVTVGPTVFVYNTLANLL
jgi:hypothetical protein